MQVQISWDSVMLDTQNCEKCYVVYCYWNPSDKLLSVTCSKICFCVHHGWKECFFELPSWQLKQPGHYPLTSLINKVFPHTEWQSTVCFFTLYCVNCRYCYALKPRRLEVSEILKLAHRPKCNRKCHSQNQ